jgi:phytoene dehydrogenase-like protein
MSNKSIIIIGAGISGLAAGCYGRMNGYQTDLFEMHSLPGGVCTSWKRKGYTFDGGINWVGGTEPCSPFYKMWNELGAIQNRRIIYYEDLGSYEIGNGKKFVLYTDTARLESHMKEIAPEDKALIEDFIQGIKEISLFEVPTDKASELYTPRENMEFILKMMPVFKTLMKWGKLTVKDFANQFTNPVLREAFIEFWIPDLCMISLLLLLGWASQKVSGHPEGGSLPFAQSIEKRYVDLGGKIHFKSKVAKILVEKKRAIGVKLEDGTEHFADYVVSAADGYSTIFNMLDAKYINSKIEKNYKDLALFPSLIHVSIGVNRTFEDFPISVLGFNFPLQQPVTIAGKEYRRLGAHLYNFDPTMAPSGKTVIKVVLLSDYESWESLYQNEALYKAKKEEIATTIITLLDKRFPGLAQQVEVYDVATPVTCYRYTANRKGSYEGWLMTPKSFSLRMKKTLPGLRNFYMSGQWVEPGGGVPTVALSGRNVIQLICKNDHKVFMATVPKL